jgi:hypothetical protein
MRDECGVVELCVEEFRSDEIEERQHRGDRVNHGLSARWSQWFRWPLECEQEVSMSDPPVSLIPRELHASLNIS